MLFLDSEQLESLRNSGWFKSKFSPSIGKNGLVLSIGGKSGGVVTKNC